ncbi:MAG TPA: tripartite tricarboxylate transporter substrate-binding protein, partial [Reyranella sp.]|nr:tripartite tricarboxylate transporter substrate-binding protein [Reyranella sp.]
IKGIVQQNWFSLFGPGGMAPELARQLQSDFTAVLAEPDTLAKVHDLGAEPGGEAPDAFARQVREEIALWAGVAKEAGIEPE